METTIIQWLIQTVQERGVGLTILFIILFKEIPAVKVWLDGWYRRRVELEDDDRKRRADIDERMLKVWERLNEQMGNMSMVLNLLAQRLENMEGDMELMRDQLNVVADRMQVKAPTRREPKQNG